MRSKILVDARMVGEKGHGIALYVLAMARGLLERSRMEGGLPYDLHFIVQKGVQIEGFPCIEARSPFLSPQEIFEIPQILWNEEADLYHSLSFSSLIEAPCPWIVTLHDLNHLYYGSWAKKVYYQTILRVFVLRARRVLSISETTRTEVEQWLKPLRTRKPIEIVPNGFVVEETLVQDAEDSWFRSLRLESGKYFLFLGNDKPHKNFRVLEKAFEAYWQQKDAGPRWSLVSTVGSAQPGICSCEQLTGRQVRILIERAGAVVSPSLYEGFGRVPVEAFLLGCPVLLSAIPSHLEAFSAVQKSAGLSWVKDPEEIIAWTLGLQQIEKSAQSGVRRGGTQAERERVAEQGSITRVAREMDRIYRDVIGDKE